MILAGLRRFVVLVAGAAAVAALAGLAVGSLAHYPLSRAVPVSLDLVGSFFVVVGFFSGSRGPLRLTGGSGRGVKGAARWLDPHERSEGLNVSAALVSIGIALVLIGLLADPHLKLV